MFRERPQVCHYAIALCARAQGPQDGIIWDAVLRRSSLSMPLALPKGGDLSDICLTAYSVYLAGRVQDVLSSARWVSRKPPGLFMSALGRTLHPEVC